jgi:hypothetical protein
MSSDIDRQAAIAAMIAPLLEQIEQLQAEQREQAQPLAQASAGLNELAEQVATLRGQPLLFDHRTVDTERFAYGAQYCNAGRAPDATTARLG